MANVFGMVTTAKSRDYTPLALRSFFEHTRLGADDALVLVDNDGDFELPPGMENDRLLVLKPAAPQSFARNANVAIQVARERQADLFLLNNDVVFTAGWLPPLLEGTAIVSAVSNAQCPYRSGGLQLLPAMDLSDLAGREEDLQRIAAAHSAQHHGRQRVAAAPFYCARIPRAVYEKVGEFDERFGAGDGEDRDYTVRAWLAGIPQELALGSFVLHFQGKSTWRGAETAEEQAARNQRYARQFEAKWGGALTYALIGDDWNLFRSDPRLAAGISSGDLGSVIAHLRRNPSLAPFVERQQRARFGAICCIYDDEAWLEPTVESVYEACHSIWFLVGTRPWNGVPSDQQGLIDKIRSLPDPARKVRLVRGDWPTEAIQRNAGLDLLEQEGIEYCFVLDADEVHDGRQLKALMNLVRQNPQVDCWRMRWFTYWKSWRYRVDPPEADAPLVFLRTGAARFVDNRAPQRAREVTIPIEAAAIHHMSYARTDQQIRRKISTFSHAHQIVPGWFDNVWKRWDQEHGLENVHPCWPSAYRRVIEQPVSAMPPVLRRFCAREPAPAATGHRGMPASEASVNEVSRG